MEKRRRSPGKTGSLYPQVVTWMLKVRMQICRGNIPTEPFNALFPLMSTLYPSCTPKFLNSTSRGWCCWATKSSYTFPVAACRLRSQLCKGQLPNNWETHPCQTSFNLSTNLYPAAFWHMQATPEAGKQRESKLVL